MAVLLWEVHYLHGKGRGRRSDAELFQPLLWWCFELFHMLWSSCITPDFLLSELQSVCLCMLPSSGLGSGFVQKQPRVQQEMNLTLAFGMTLAVSLSSSTPQSSPLKKVGPAEN